MMHEVLTALRVVPRGLWERLAPYAGLVLGAGAWGLVQPIASFSIFARCSHAAGTPVIATNVIGAVLAMLGLIVSWRGRSFGGEEGRAVIDRRFFVAIVSTTFAAIVLFALLAGTMAGVILRCEQ